jgi:hypothetical protein
MLCQKLTTVKTFRLISHQRSISYVLNKHYFDVGISTYVIKGELARHNPFNNDICVGFLCSFLHGTLGLDGKYSIYLLFREWMIDHLEIESTSIHRQISLL